MKLENGLVCGGAYLKFLTADPKFVPSKLHDKSPFTIMFGPDKCGETNKVCVCWRPPSTGPPASRFTSS